MLDMTDLMLGIVSVLIAVSTFSNNRRKDNIKDGEQSGALTTELTYIKTLLQEVRDETREFKATYSGDKERLAKVEAEVESAFTRIKHIEQQIGISQK